MTQWLLEGDPAIRWQTLHNLVGANERTVERERRKVAREGWGSRLLARQDAEGSWAGGLSSDDGLYSPKWISTTYTMLTLRDFGLPAAARQTRTACRLLLDGGLRKDGGINYGPWGNRGETCITGMVLSILSHFEYDDDRLDVLAGHLLQVQMPDGGWNCRRPYGATHSSVHTTILALEGLHLYEKYRGHQSKAVRQAQSRAREFLLIHRLFRSHRTGEIIKPIFVRFLISHPGGTTTYSARSTIFRPLTRRATRDLPTPSKSSSEARLEDGRWTLHNSYKGKTYFELERLASRVAGIHCARCES